jgi:NRPS condensation-like uncharacterized protein
MATAHPEALEQAESATKLRLVTGVEGALEAEQAPPLAKLPAREAVQIAPADGRLETNWMDRAILAQTYAGRPMTTHHVLDVAVPFDRARLLQAVDALVRSVPTLRSFVHESPFGIERRAAKARWSHLDAIVTFSETPIDLSTSGWFLRNFDLANEEPFRVLHSPCPGGYQLVFTLHHSVTDGVGALALFDALLAHYGALSGEHDDVPAPIAPNGAPLRRLLARGGAKLALELIEDNVRRAGRFTDRRASLLERPDAQAEALHCEVIDLPAATWQRLRDRAREIGCSRNDLMLAALLRASAAWRRDEGMKDEDFRALVPVDLRGELGIGPSLQNHLGVVEADFGADEVDAEDLPRTVSARLKAERAPERVLATPMALAALGKVLPPFVFRRFFRWLDERRSSFMYSFLFSHIRVPEGLRVPRSVRMRRIYCLSGLPRQPGIGWTVTALPNAVTIALAYTPPRLSDEGAKRLLARFAAALEEA